MVKTDPEDVNTPTANEVGIGYSVLIHQDPESGLFVAEVPDLPGCYSQGETPEEAQEGAAEAIGLHLDEIPPERIPRPTEYWVRQAKVSVS